MGEPVPATDITDRKPHISDLSGEDLARLGAAGARKAIAATRAAGREPAFGEDLEEAETVDPTE